MIDLLLTIGAFALALCLLIAVHEYGHFWVARTLGVKVLRFSIGFGPVVWSRRSRDGEVEYLLCALPLGGYVKMLDEREGNVEEAERGRAFNTQGVGKRMAIVVAGPLFNFLFAIVAYWMMFVVGVSGIKPIVGAVDEGTPAYHAGLLEGDEIVAVKEQPTTTWRAVLDNLTPSLLLRESVGLEAVREGVSRHRVVRFDTLSDDISPSELLGKVGLRPYSPPIRPIIDSVVDGRPAALSGMMVGDEVLSVAGVEVASWQELVRVIEASADMPLKLRLMRGQESVELVVTPQPVSVHGRSVGKIGAGVKIDSKEFERFRSELRYGVFKALGVAINKTFDMSVLTLRLLGEMMIGRASVENISGPITIAQFAKASAMAGFSQFLAFLAIVSLSLGVLNLLPIPVLDGGHLMYYCIELIRGKAVSEKVESIGQRIGISLILMLMLIAFYNDFARLSS